MFFKTYAEKQTVTKAQEYDRLEPRAKRMERLLREAVMDYGERMPKEWLKNAREVLGVCR